MKKLIHKLRLWLLCLLHGVTEERHSAVVHAGAEEICKLRSVVRKICRCGDRGYYDWCCEYCTAECDKRNGWCARFRV